MLTGVEKVTAERLFALFVIYLRYPGVYLRYSVVCLRYPPVHLRHCKKKPDAAAPDLLYTESFHLVYVVTNDGRGKIFGRLSMPSAVPRFACALL